MCLREEDPQGVKTTEPAEWMGGAPEVHEGEPEDPRGLYRIPRVGRLTIKFGPDPKRRPRIGDKKTAKDGVVMVRRQCTFEGGYLVRNGRPVCEWGPVHV